jgi:hypothetical protein
MTNSSKSTKNGVYFFVFLNKMKRIENYNSGFFECNLNPLRFLIESIWRSTVD